MGEVHVLPGVERRDLVGVPLPSEEVLQAAIDKGITGVIVVGLDRKGDLYVAGTYPDTDKAVGVLMRAVGLLSTCTVVNDVVIGEPDDGSA